MSRYKRTRIRVATREVIAIRQTLPAQASRYCTPCGGTTAWLELDEAIARCSLSAREIFRLVEVGIIHFLEAADGRSLLCSNSLAKYLIEKKER